MLEEKKTIELKDEELENFNGGGSVETGWAACENYVPVENAPSLKMCGNCRYCDMARASSGTIWSVQADCHYPEMVNK